MTNLEQGDVVLCNVDRIVGTTVFVNIENYGEGKIIMSEIAPGRIRNLRDYVVPKKTIVCKILRISGDKIDLSLRRVTPKERKEVLAKHKIEKSYRSIIKSVAGEKTSEIIEKIKEIDTLYNFIEDARENPETLDKFFNKEEAKKIQDILGAQKPKISILKKEISFTTTHPEGLSLIKENLEKIKDAEIKYISAGKYSIKVEAEDMKTAGNKIKEIITELEKNAKKGDFELKESQ
jgi:translation initiation factor 2 alpha subunit (eIF-2alpha)